MIKIKEGNILNCQEEIIVHQVNVDGIMGGGVARQLADQFKNLEKFYSDYCKKHGNYYELLSGTVLYYDKEDKFIANMFSQFPNFETDYIAMKKCFENIKQVAIMFDIDIAIPYGIGCGIANGDWNIVYKIIEEVFEDYEVTLYKYEK